MRSKLLIWLTLIVSQSAGEDDSRMGVCRKKWVKMTDENYQRTLEHYAECAELARSLDPATRARYQDSVIINMRKTCNYFFDRSNLPVPTLIGVLREVSKILEGLDEGGGFVLSAPKSSHTDQTDNPLDSGEWTLPPVCESVEDSTQESLHLFSRGKRTKLILWGLFWIIVFTVVIQLLFILWLFCVSACLAGARAEEQKDGQVTKRLITKDHPGSGTKRSKKESHHPPILREQRLPYISESQAELSSLSSENLGSDLELEVLLGQNKVSKVTRKKSKQDK